MKGVLSSVMNQFRQWSYPPEFRITVPAWPPELLASYERLATLTLSAGARAGEPQVGRTLAEIGTGLWRLQQKMVDPATRQPTDEMRRSYRHVEAMWDALTKANVEIIDHTNLVFDAGLAISVLAIQPTPGLTCEMVIETIKPTIYFQGERLQMGEVIVGKPVAAPDITPTSTAPALSEPAPVEPAPAESDTKVSTANDDGSQEAASIVKAEQPQPVPIEH